MNIVSPGAGSNPFSASMRTAGIVNGQLFIRTFPLSTSIRRSGAPHRVVIGQIFSSRLDL
jgi:hypothetical protein